MSIQINAEPDSGFDDPIGMLSDCHRRIEKFLEQQILLAERARSRALEHPEREMLHKSLRYFAKGAPTHTADEEESLFPRLRQVNTPKVREVLARVRELESEHRAAETAHSVVDRLGKKWLSQGQFSSEECDALVDVLRPLRETYRTHIQFEDAVLFPLALRVLNRKQVEEIGREMARRRGLDYDALPLINRCAQRRLDREKTEAA